MLGGVLGGVHLIRANASGIDRVGRRRMMAKLVRSIL